MFGLISELFGRSTLSAPSIHVDYYDMTCIDNPPDLERKELHMMRSVLALILGYNPTDFNETRHWTPERIQRMQEMSYEDVACPDLIYCWGVLLNMSNIKGRESDLTDLLNLFCVPIERRCPKTPHAVWETLATILKPSTARLLQLPSSTINTTTAKALIQEWDKELAVVRDYKKE